MDMLRADKFTKWRIKSISPISGNVDGTVDRADAGMPDITGTSQAGVRWQRRPVWESSKRSSVASEIMDGTDVRELDRLLLKCANVHRIGFLCVIFVSSCLCGFLQENHKDTKTQRKHKEDERPVSILKR